MPLPLALGIAGLAISAIGTGAGIAGNAAQRKAALAAEKERKRQAAVAAGADAFAQSQAMANPFYDNDPFSSNEKTLYDGGGTDDATSAVSTGGSAWGSPEAFATYGSIISNVGNMINTGMQTKYAKDDVKRLKTEGAAMNLALSNRIAMDAQKERNEYLNNRYNYATGGAINASSQPKGLVQQSSDTAVVKAGTHESGNDLSFTRQDGTQAAVEGQEGIQMKGSGVNIFSDRIAVPGDSVSIAERFQHLSSLKGDLEKRLKTDANIIGRNTKSRQIQSTSNALDKLFAIQETLKGISKTVNQGQQFAYGGKGDEAVNGFDIKSVGNGIVQPQIRNAITAAERREGPQFSDYSVVNPSDSTISVVNKDGKIIDTSRYKTNLEKEFKSRVSYAGMLRNLTPEQRAKSNIDEADYQRIISETDHGISKRGITRSVREYAQGGQLTKRADGKYVDENGVVFLDEIGTLDETVTDRLDIDPITKKPAPYSVNSKTLKTMTTPKYAGERKQNNNFLKTAFNTANSQGGMNALATTLTLMDNIYNDKLMNKMKPEEARFVSKVSLDKHYDTSAEEHAVKSQVQGFYENVDKNVTSSSVGLNMKLSAMAEGLGKLNQIQQNKNRIESELTNKEILANSEVDKANAMIYNQYKDQNAAHYMRKSANFSNAIDDISQGLLRGIKIKTDKEEFMVNESKYAKTGVAINQLQSGFYKEAGGEAVDKAVQEIANAGRTYKDYVAAIDEHNNLATAGSKRKRMTRAEYEKLKTK